MSDVNPLNQYYMKLCTELGDLMAKKALLEYQIQQKTEDITSLNKLAPELSKQIGATNGKPN